MEQASPTSSRRRQAVAANVIRACRTCGAPGVFSAEPSVREKWPGCYASRDNPHNGQPVGAMCPNCAADRGPGLIERLGEIWHRYL